MEWRIESAWRRALRVTLEGDADSGAVEVDRKVPLEFKAIPFPIPWDRLDSPVLIGIAHHGPVVKTLMRSTQ
jgi:hypothetical protein